MEIPKYLLETDGNLYGYYTASLLRIHILEIEEAGYKFNQVFELRSTINRPRYEPISEEEFGKKIERLKK